MKKNPRGRVTLHIALAVAVLFALATLVEKETTLEEPAKRPAKAGAAASRGAMATPAIAPQSATVAGVTVQVDPITGRLIPPTQAQRQALADALRQRFQQPSPSGPFYYANGMLSLVVATDRMSFSLARVADTGTVELDCVTGVEEAATRLEQPFSSQREDGPEEEE